MNRIGSAEIGQSGERGAHGAAGIEDVVNQDDAGAVDRERDVATDEAGIAGSAAAVVAIRRNVDSADGSLAGGAKFRSETVGETRAAADDADQCERAGVAVALLDDFVGDALDAAGDGLGVEGGR
jgi:hypothetical protein